MIRGQAAGGARNGRPHPGLLLLLAPALVAVSHQTDRYWVGAAIMLAAVLAYRLPLSIDANYWARTVASLVMLGVAYVLALGTTKPLPSIFPPFLFTTCALWLALVAGATWYGMGRIFGPWWLFLVTGLLLVLAGNTDLSWWYTICVWSWVLAALGLLAHPASPLLGRRAGRTPPVGFQILALVGAVLLASLLYVGFDLLVHRLEIWLTRWIDQTFSSAETVNDLSAGVDLASSMPSKLSTMVALRVTGTRPPEHLRGNILVTYRGGHWYNNWSRYRPAQALPLDWQAGELAKRFPLRNAVRILPHAGVVVNKDWWHLHIQANLASNSVAFSPAGARVVSMPHKVTVDGLGILRVPGASIVPDYDLAGEPSGFIPAPRLRPAEAALNLDLPPQLRPRLRAIAAAWTRGAPDAVARAVALEVYFRTHFEYSLQVRIPPHADPVLYFLESRPPAYCAYFASGMALLLRSLDIPAHVVTGYLTGEYNPFGQFFLVRENEAHGWVEAYDAAAGGWVTYDPTPPSLTGGTAGTHRSRLALAWEYWSWWLAGQWAAFRDAGMLDRLLLLGAALDAAIRWPGTWVALLLGGIFGWWRRRRQTGVAALARSRNAMPALLLHPDLLAQLEAALRQRGIPIDARGTCADWLVTVREADLPRDDRARLAAAIRCYRRARFDPAGGAAALSEAQQAVAALLVKGGTS